jgi:hypothetical protein
MPAIPPESKDASFVAESGGSITGNNLDVKGRLPPRVGKASGGGKITFENMNVRSASTLECSIGDRRYQGFPDASLRDEARILAIRLRTMQDEMDEAMSKIDPYAPQRAASVFPDKASQLRAVREVQSTNEAEKKAIATDFEQRFTAALRGQCAALATTMLGRMPPIPRGPHIPLSIRRGLNLIDGGSLSDPTDLKWARECLAFIAERLP